MSEEMREEMEQNDTTGTEDIYQVYMEELAVIPPCPEEENRELLKRVKDGDREAKTRLVEGNLKKTLFFIQDYLNRGVPMADLIQEASMELMELADEGFQEGFEKLLESRIHVRMEEVIREQKAEMDLEEEMQCAPGGLKAHGGGAGKRSQLKGAGRAHEDDRGGCAGDHEDDHGCAEAQRAEPQPPGLIIY